MTVPELPSTSSSTRTRFLSENPLKIPHSNTLQPYSYKPPPKSRVRRKSFSDQGSDYGRSMSSLDSHSAAIIFPVNVIKFGAKKEDVEHGHDIGNDLRHGVEEDNFDETREMRISKSYQYDEMISSPEEKVNDIFTEQAILSSEPNLIVSYGSSSSLSNESSIVEEELQDFSDSDFGSLDMRGNVNVTSSPLSEPEMFKHATVDFDELHGRVLEGINEETSQSLPVEPVEDIKNESDEKANNFETNEINLQKDYLRRLGVIPSASKNLSRKPSVDISLSAHNLIFPDSPQGNHLKTEFVPLKLQSNRKPVDNSFFGLALFNKVSKWFKATPASTDLIPPLEADPDHNSTVEAEGKNTLKRSPSQEKVEQVELGLEKRAIVTRSNYDKKLRQKAQEVVLRNKKNVSFLSEAEVLSIPSRNNMSKRAKSKIWFSRREFMELVVRNMKQMEVEMRLRSKRSSREKFR